MKWAAAAVLAMLLWGVWGVLLKIVSSGARWHEVYLASNTAILVFMAGILAVKGPGSMMGHGARWFLLAFAAGAMGTLGYILLVLSLQWGGRASIVIPLTSLYPLVTVVLSAVALGEPIDARRALGILMAAAAIVLLTYEPQG